MELAQPERLAWLLLLPLLYFLARPPRPRHVQLTAHLAQWIAARDSLNRRPVRLRWLRLILLTLALIVVIIAHATPRLVGKPGADDLVILLDCSASMSATSAAEARSPFERARRSVLDALETVPDHVDLRLGLCGDEVRVVRGSRSTLAAELASIEPAGVCRVDLRAMARSLRDANTAVWTLTDGLGLVVPPDVGALTLLGEESANVGITACEVEDDWPLPELRIVATVANNSDRPRQIELLCFGGVVAPVARRVEIPAGASKRLRVPMLRGKGGRLAVRLRSEPDALRADDEVLFTVPPPPRPRIAVQGEDGVVPPDLAAAAHALAVECGGEVVSAAAVEKAAYLLMDGGSLNGPQPGGRILSFGAALQGHSGEAIAAPRLLDWNRQSSITAGLDLSELQIAVGRPLTSDLEGEVLMRGESGSLAVLVRGKSTASVHVAFRLGDTNFGKLAAFPQFVRRCFASSYGRRGGSRLLPGSLLDAAESDLGRNGRQTVDRPLPAFSEPATRLAIPLLVLGLLCLAIRAYV